VRPQEGHCKKFLALAVIAIGLSTCPSKEIVIEQMEAVATVQRSIQSVFSRVLDNPVTANISLTNMEVYVKITTNIGVPATPSRFAQFHQ